ncbi:hypothetical protein [Arthrobacter methylotrophus]
MSHDVVTSCPVWLAFRSAEALLVRQQLTDRRQPMGTLLDAVQ